MREDIRQILESLPFFKGLREPLMGTLAKYASVGQFEPNEFIFKEGGEANHFYVIRHGQVALEIYAPERGPLTIETLSEDDVLGWSWLISPYRWHFDARAEVLTRAIVLDGRSLRARFERDHELGYELYKRFSVLMAQRLQATRLQILDVYGMKP